MYVDKYFLHCISHSVKVSTSKLALAQRYNMLTAMFLMILTPTAVIFDVDSKIEFT